MRFGVVAIFAVACSADDYVVKPGIIEFYEEQMLIETPASVSIRAQFPVRVFTFGGGCVSLEDTTVELVPDGAIVTPRDRSLVTGSCTDVLQTFEHAAVLSFTTAGTKVVRFRGRRVPGEAELEIPYTIVVE